MNTLALMAIHLLIAAPIEESGPWKLVPKHRVGQEIVYNGTVTEVTTGANGARFEQPYELQASMLVMDVSGGGDAEIGCYTVMRLPDYRARTKVRKSFDSVTSSHFALVKCSPVGKATWLPSEVEIMLPPSGRVAWELNYLFEVPNKPLDTGATWTLHHAGQESTQCRVTGMESVLGIGCVKVETMQQSQNWDADNIALPAWMNRASIWIDPKSRIVRRLHRDYRVRRPGDTQPSQALLAQYDLTSDFQYHGEHLQQRIADFRAGHTAQNHLEQALASIDRQRPRLLANLKDTIELTLRDKLYWTPYRPAILAMISLADYKSNESKAGETVRQRSEPQSLLGRKARNFVIRVAETDETLTLKKVAGKPVVLVFMDPSSPLSIRALRTAVWAAQNHAELAPTVYAVCTEIGEDTAKQLKEAVPGAFTICTGKGIDRAYGVDAVPYTLYIDASGYLRGSYVGYGPEMTTALVADLRRKEADVENVGKGGGTSPSFLR